jgi:chromatin segregation and condensation protein Rec8/ScpA/Scc1 (kleisin family)
VWRRSASASTFLAALELAKQGDVLMGQLDAFTPIQVTLAAA